MTSCAYDILSVAAMMLSPFVSYFVYCKLQSLLKVAFDVNLNLGQATGLVPVSALLLTLFFVLVEGPKRINITDCETGKPIKTLVYNVYVCRVRRS